MAVMEFSLRLGETIDLYDATLAPSHVQSRLERLFVRYLQVCQAATSSTEAECLSNPWYQADANAADRFLTEIKSARMLRFPLVRRRISTGPRSSFAELPSFGALFAREAAGHAILVLNSTMRGRSTGCGRIYEDRFSMRCPPAST
jgi:hypothetical protein